jgi:hypothetical protein
VDHSLLSYVYPVFQLLLTLVEFFIAPLLEEKLSEDRIPVLTLLMQTGTEQMEEDG